MFGSIVLITPTLTPTGAVVNRVGQQVSRAKLVFSAKMAGLLRVAELVEMQHLGIEVLSGRGGLQKHISWAHVSEMYDPTPWLEGGELLLSVGLHFSTSAHEQVAFLERLHGKGVVAFGLPRPRLPLLTQSLLRVSDERSFPILLLPIELSFIEVVRLVAVANQLSAQRHVMTHLRILDALNASVNQGLAQAWV